MTHSSIHPKTYAFSIGISIALASLSMAGETDTYPEPMPMMPPPSAAPPSSGWLEGWEFRLAPYFWGSGLDGDVGVNGLVTDVDLDFTDILDNLDASVMLAFDARHDRIGFLVEGLWLKMSDSFSTPGRAFSEVDLKIEQVMLNGAIYYRLFEAPFTLDLAAGARYIYVDADIDLDPGLAAGRSADGSKEWVDPVIGIRTRFPITDQFYGFLAADVGGFGVSSDLTWQLFGGLGYRFSETLDAFVGWRHLAIDYDRGDFVYDVDMDGLVFGMGISF